ncbi:GGDEF domain-containing protein [Paucibacter sp. DJ1R-11]|uniref:GGDEF domain-containing protein n=1 Tax=Paucibacter sp. DJ1R-11 TaxID=2893556 RepID=UPI0021E4A6E5|nr:GGDEF domain-containing protein [Paucibacter sp. DJ1R-11]MCV2366132.1 GGDEF domain-containing protein [Paucibacter sp. DJ1R-11]
MNATPTMDPELQRAYGLLDQGQLAAARDLAQNCLETAQEDELATSRAAIALGLIAAYDSRHEEAMQRLLPHVPVLEATEARHELGRAYSVLGFSLGMLGDPERGLEWASKALALAEQQGAARELVRAHLNRAVLISQMGDWQLAEQSLSVGIEQAQAHGYGLSACAGLSNLAEIHLTQALRCRELHDDAAAARHAQDCSRWYERAAEACILHGQKSILGETHVKHARALVLQGQLTGVPALLQLAAPVAAENAALRAELGLTRGMAAAEGGREQEAREALERALLTAQECREPDLTHQILFELSHLERSYGHLQAALQRYEQRHQLMMEHYKRRLRMVARSAEVWAEAEQARLSARAAIQREAALIRSQAELMARAAQLQQDAMCDGLTELLNRRGLEAQARAFWDAGPELSQLTLALIDADHFKHVNDQCGHAVGDAVLKQLARLLQQDIRASDVLARLGGEEFVLLLPERPLGEARQICERVRQRVADFDWSRCGTSQPVSVSIGVAQRQPGDDLEALLCRADKAMYSAKSGGRNCVREAGI